MAKLPMPAGDPHDYKGHSGIDFMRGPSQLGKPILASGPGRVVRLSRNAAGGYWTVVKYDAIPYEVGYAHKRSHAGSPKPGSRIGLGTRLGYVGDLGTRVTGPHVHVEILGRATSSAIWDYFDRNRTVAQALAGKVPTAGGSEVKYGYAINKVQYRVNQLGYTPKLDEDGIDGPKTRSGVRWAQGKLGVKQDGKWGKGTQEAYDRRTPAAPSFPLAEGEFFGPEGLGSRSVSGYHSHSVDLKRFQQRMRDRGWKIKVDGRYGPEGAKTPQGNTADIVRAFQKEKGLEPDALIGPDTWAAAWTTPVT